MPPVRRLAAILAADVAGYSRLMGADEEGTHERLKAHIRDLIEPKIAEHRGRIVKNTGDGFLAEFTSVVDAVRCAAEIQRGMADREPEVTEERQIRFRIGINLGDVIAEEHDIFGDGVNVAARLEALAEPGGICVSRMVRENVRDKLDYTFEDRGEQSVKNITRPVRVYALRPETGAELPMADAPIAVQRRRRSIVPQVAAAVIAAALVIAVIVWWVWPAPKATSTPSAAVASIAQPLVTPATVDRRAELGSVRLLKAELEARGINSKSWTSASGRLVGGKPKSAGERQAGLTLLLVDTLAQVSSALAPDIIQATLDGRQPRDLTADKLLAHSRLPLGWHEQRTALGFV